MITPPAPTPARAPKRLRVHPPRMLEGDLPLWCYLGFRGGKEETDHVYANITTFVGQRPTCIFGTKMDQMVYPDFRFHFERAGHHRNIEELHFVVFA